MNPLRGCLRPGWRTKAAWPCPNRVPKSLARKRWRKNTVRTLAASTRFPRQRRSKTWSGALLAPMTRHLAEELWEMLGHGEGMRKVSWPTFNQELAREDEVEIVVQVSGRVRGRVKVSAGAGEEEVVKLALADAGVAHHADGKRIVKKIFVRDKLLNLVVAGS